MWNRPTMMLLAFNFMYYMTNSIFSTFMPVYFADAGISPSQIGVLLGVGMVTGIFAPPFWGYISDKWGDIKKVLLLIMACMTIAGTMLFVSSSLTLLFLFTFATFFFLSPAGPLTDTVNYRVAEERGINYGSIRLFGSFGYGISALVVGIILDAIGMNSIAYLFLGSGLITLAIGFFLPKQKSASTPVSMAAIKKFFAYRPTLWLMVLITLLSIPHRTNDSFIGVYLQDLGATTTMVGQSWFIGTVMEGIVFSLAAYWLRKGNELYLMAISAIVYAVRFFLYGFISDPHIIMWLQVLHGVSYVFFYAAAIQYLYRKSPDELKATSQTIYGGVFFGVAGIIGSVGGGWIMGRYGGDFLYQAMGALSVVTFVLIAGTILKSRGAEKSAVLEQR